MQYISKRTRTIAYVGSSMAFVLVLALGLLITRYHFDPTFIVPTTSDSANYFLADEVIGLGIIGALMPSAAISVINYRYLRAVEKNIPPFLRDVLQGTDSGLMLPKALIEASKNGHGPVSKEFGIAMTKFTFGYDFSKAVEEAGKRLRHAYAPQAAVIISEAYVAGAKMHDVLTSSVAFFNNLEEYSEQRQSELKPYTQLVYISIGIFLVISLVVLSSFIAPLASLHVSSASVGSSTETSGAANFSIQTSNISYYRSIFFFAALIESFFGGIVAGKIVDASAGAGLRHSLILIGISTIAFIVAGHF